MDMMKIKIPEIMTDAFGRVDRKLMSHCERVAYSMMDVLDQLRWFDFKMEIRILWTILLHDIGLFHRISDNAREDNESDNKYSHSEYGYLFLREFTPHAFLADLVRYHHSSWKTISDTPDLTDEMKDVVRILKVMDQIDLGGRCAGSPLPEKLHHLAELAAERTLSLSEECVHRELMERFEQYGPSEQEERFLLRTLVNAIDFRSHYTAIHCFVAEKVADCIGEISGLDEEEKEVLHVGVMLHDLGKIAIPLDILESPSALSEEEWAIMKSHVVITGELLENRVDDEVFNIAVRHHETLDGTGYPYGIKGDCITKKQRIAAVADIISALTERRSYKKPFQPEQILDILSQMSRNGKICSEIVEIVEQNQNSIFDAASRARKEIISVYRSMMSEYESMKGSIV